MTILDIKNFYESDLGILLAKYEAAVQNAWSSDNRNDLTFQQRQHIWNEYKEAKLALVTKMMEMCDGG